MKITVATVCYNCADTIELTMNSVLGQSYENIEYIIVDGASTDTTMSIVRRYENDNHITVVSEPDKGLYDAMNKAADLASGDYILYMNSGDVFASDDAVEKMVPYLLKNSPMVYGNVIRIKENGEYLETYSGKHREMVMALQGKMMSHQSIFTRTDIMRKYRFNLEYSITADYDFVLRLMHDHQQMQYADVTVSKVENIEGISSKTDNLDKMRKQDDMSLKQNFPLWYWIIYIPKGIVRITRRFLENK